MNEAVPYEEFKQNPYTVLCTTSLGGHLSWFEPGSGRWHAKPICNFLKIMANEISLESARAHPNGLKPKSELPTKFDPVRRKLELVREHQVECDDDGL